VPRRSDHATNEADTLRAYLRGLARLPRLTADEEAALGARIRQDRDEAALRRLVEGNLRFVVSYAKRYRGLGVPFLDLVHEGNLGLIEAAQRFDPARNVKFITYAVWWVRQAMMHALSGEARAFSLPVKVSSLAVRFERQVAALAAQLERAPTTQEIAEDLDLSPCDVDALRQISGEDVSLSDPVDAGRGGRELGETLAQEAEPPVEHALIQQAMQSGLQAALAELDGRERRVLQMRYGLGADDGRTLQQIGNALHLTRERVRQIEARAKDKLRRSKRLEGLRSCLN